MPHTFNNMPKIYTKTGDTGETSLLGGKRVSKSCVEIDAIGEVDELNAQIGVLVATLASLTKPPPPLPPLAGSTSPPSQGGDSMANCLSDIQHLLFNIGGMIAAVQTELVNVPRITEQQIAELEKWIDEMETALPPLTQFILPGGTPAAAQSFLARAVCRRAERSVVALRETHPNLDPLVQKYLNRLSDALFAFGQYINMTSGVTDTVWKK